MKTLKDLKDALNKLPDEELDEFFITHGMWLEEPVVKLGAVWCSDKDDTSKLTAMYDREEFKVITQFVLDLSSDAEKVFACKCNPSLEEDEQYIEDIPEKDN